MRSNKKRKKKYDSGGFIDKLKQGKGANLLGIAGSAINALGSPENEGTGLAGGILQGVGMGSTLGIPGMIGGAVIGGITGLVGAKSAKDKEIQRRNAISNIQQGEALRQPGKAQMIKHGGKLLSKRLKVIQGGSLNPISDDAVEVNANNPSQSDSVELQDAFVDDNEVIDRENRVFSDAILTPSGRTIAKEAKSLEKMKGGGRFGESNSRIDSRLDALFKYQEDMKKNHNHNNFTNTEENLEHPGEQAVMKKGGKIHIKPQNKGKFTAYKKRTGKTTEEALHSSDPHVRKMANFARNAKKWHHEEGGMLEQPDPKKKSSLLLKAENKSELQDYHRSAAGKSLGLSADANLSNADQVLRAMDIVGNNFKMADDFVKADDKVTRAFKAVRKHKNGGYLFGNQPATKYTPLKKKFLLGGPGDGDGPGDGSRKNLAQEGDPKFKDAYSHNQFYIDRAKKSMTPEQIIEFDNQNSGSTNAKLGQLNPQQQQAQDLGFLVSRFDFPQYKEPQDYRLALYKSLQPGGTATPVAPRRGVVSAGLKKGGYLKPKLKKGDLLSYNTDGSEIQEQDTPNLLNTDFSKQFAIDRSTFGGTTALTKSGFDWNKAGTAAATFGPNIASAFLQKRLQGPLSPQLENKQRLQRVNPNYQLQEIASDFNNTNKLLTRNTAQAGNLTAALSGTLSKKLAATNQVFGQNQQLNAMIQGQEAQLNQGVEARNAGRTNQYLSDKVDYNNMKQQLSSQNISNLASKMLLQGKERNMIALDKEKWDIAQQKWGDLPQAMKDKYSSFDEFMRDYTKKKFGGRIQSKDLLGVGLSWKGTNSARIDRSIAGPRVRKNLMKDRGNLLPVSNFRLY